VKRRHDPLSVLGSIGAVPPFQYITKSNDSSPLLSDDYMYSSADDLRRLSNSTVSSEGTISPKDSVLFSSETTDVISYYSHSTPALMQSPASYHDTPAPMSPISPPPKVRQFSRLHNVVKPEGETEALQSGPGRRRSTKITPASSAPAPRLSGVSNHNNSKPMTARDRKRRQMHNASAMRSRIRLNETLDKMWKTIPVSRRRKRLPQLGENGEGSNDPMEDMDEEEEERIGRADKVEVGIDYILYLEDRVRELEQRLNVHGN